MNYHYCANCRKMTRWKSLENVDICSVCDSAYRFKQPWSVKVEKNDRRTRMITLAILFILFLSAVILLVMVTVPVQGRPAHQGGPITVTAGPTAQMTSTPVKPPKDVANLPIVILGPTLTPEPTVTPQDWCFFFPNDPDCITPTPTPPADIPTGTATSTPTETKEVLTHTPKGDNHT